MAGIVADTHVLLWMLDGTLPKRSQVAANRVETAVREKAVHVSIGSFLDLRYLVDSGRRPPGVLEEARSIVDGEAFSVVPLDLSVIDEMANVPKDEVPDPFDRIIAATALSIGLPIATGDERIREALGELAIW